MSEATATAEAPVEVDPAIKELGDKIASLTLKQAVDLKDYLKSAYGLEPAAGGAVMLDIDYRPTLWDDPRAFGPMLRRVLARRKLVLDDPDAVTVEALILLQLTARRLGRRLRLRHAPAALEDLRRKAKAGKARGTQTSER